MWKPRHPLPRVVSQINYSQWVIVLQLGTHTKAERKHMPSHGVRKLKISNRIVYADSVFKRYGISEELQQVQHNKKEHCRQHTQH